MGCIVREKNLFSIRNKQIKLCHTALGAGIAHCDSDLDVAQNVHQALKGHDLMVYENVCFR